MLPFFVLGENLLHEQIEYVDTWTVTYLPPAPEFDQVYNSAGTVEFRRREEVYSSPLIGAISAFYRLD
jgi:hypothetical protein